MRFMLCSCLLPQLPFYQGVILIFQSYSLRNAFPEAVSVIDSSSSNAPAQNTLKSFWRGLTILDAVGNICDSWQRFKISVLPRVCKK